MLADARHRPDPSIAAPFRNMRLALDTIEILKSQVAELSENGCEIYTTWGPPGTGKTTWSSEKFIELALEGYEPVMITFSRNALESMRFGVDKAAKNLTELKESFPKDQYFKRFRTIDSIAYSNFRQRGEAYLQRNPDKDASEAKWSLIGQDGNYAPLLTAAEQGDVEVMTAAGEAKKTIYKFAEWAEENEIAAKYELFGAAVRVEDSPLTPGPVWAKILEMHETLAMYADEEKTKRQYYAWMLIWIMFCWHKKVFRFQDSLWYACNDPTWGDIAGSPKAMIVDEAQDLSPSQMFYIHNLCRISGVARLYIVGDPNQAIMGFRGASAEPFTDIYLPTAKNKKRDVFLGKAYRYGQNICEPVENFRLDALSEVSYQDTRKVKSSEHGGKFAAREWETEAIAEEISTLSKENYVYVLFTNRYVSGWKDIVEKLWHSDVPFGYLTGVDTSPQGICGAAFQRKPKVSSDSSDWDWSWLEVKRYQNLAIWVNEFARPDLPSDIGGKVSRIVGFFGLTVKSMTSDWEKKLATMVREKTETDETSPLDYKKMRDIELSETEIKKLVSRKVTTERTDTTHAEIAEQITSGDTTLIDKISNTFIRAINPSSYHNEISAPRPTDPLDTTNIYTRISKTLKEYKYDKCENPQLLIATVHQAKGRECDIAYFHPAGPRRRDHPTLDEDMMRVYYVGISRGKAETNILVPGRDTADWSYTSRLKAWSYLHPIADEATTLEKETEI